VARHVVQLYPAGARALWVALPAALPAARLSSGLAVERSGQRHRHAWLPVQEQFVPQMLNYESVGGVNFKKAATPARKWWPQPVPRHAQAPRLHRTRRTAAGRGRRSVCRQRCRAARGHGGAVRRSPCGGFDAIVSLQIASTDEALNAGGVALALQPLPYELLADI
jgi:hypothetical protein